jgi:hypothetical protein
MRKPLAYWVKDLHHHSNNFLFYHHLLGKFFFYSLLIFLCLIENVLQEKFEDTNDVITIRNLRKDRQTMIDIILHRKLMIEQHEPPLKTRLNSGPTEG